MYRAPLLLSVMAASLLASSAHAADLAYAGVWQGTLGDRPVMVCFESFTSSYYDLQTLSGMRLNEASPEVYNRPDAQKISVEQWLVGNEAHRLGSWKIESADAGQISGTWRSHDGREQKPLQLKPLQPAVAAGSCSFSDDPVASPASAYLRYNGARIEAAEVRPEPASFEGHSYSKISNTGGSAVQLEDNSAGAAVINPFARNWLQTQVANAWDCELSARDVTGQKPDKPQWARELAPAYWSTRWLVLRDNLPATFCGGAHDTSSTSWYSFDLTSGQQVDPSQWFVGLPAPEEQEDEQIQTPLLKLIASRLQTSSTPPKGCEDASYSIQASPDASGVVFHTSHPYAQRACNAEASIPWAELKPFLTPTGLQAMQGTH